MVQPVNLHMPVTDERDGMSHVPGVAALVMITLMVTVGAWIALMTIREDHTMGDKPMTAAQQQCFDEELQKQIDSIGTNLPGGDTSRCTTVVPAYAAHPFWYALIIGATVFVVGRVGVFMVRMERTRGY